MFNAGLLLTFLTYCFYQLKSVPSVLFGQIKKRIVYTVTIDQSSSLYHSFEAWLNKNHSCLYRNVRATTDSNDSPRFSHFTDIFSFKYQGKRIVVKKEREKFENAATVDGAFYHSYVLHTINAKDQVSNLLQEAIEYHNSLRTDEQYIYVNDQHGEWQYVRNLGKRNVDSVVVGGRDALINDLLEFVKSEDFYVKRGVTYKRGVLLFGSPGNGKTSLCVAIARKLNRHVYFMNLNDVEKDAKLIRAFSSLPNNAVLVLEDIDAAFTNRSGHAKVSFSAILNCIDGAISPTGTVIIMTTNHIDHIDSALLRNGRIDFMLSIPNPGKELVEEYLSLFYGREISLPSYNLDVPMSTIQDICFNNKDNADKAIKELGRSVK